MCVLCTPWVSFLPALLLQVMQISITLFISNSQDSSATMFVCLCPALPPCVLDRDAVLKPLVRSTCPLYPGSFDSGVLRDMCVVGIWLVNEDSDYYMCLTRGQSKDQNHYNKGWCMHVKDILGDVLHSVIYIKCWDLKYSGWGARKGRWMDTWEPMNKSLNSRKWPGTHAVSHRLQLQWCWYPAEEAIVLRSTWPRTIS